jgi:alpha-glucosidase
MLLLTLRGTPTLYYGDEIGMQDVAIAPERVRDTWTQREPGVGVGRDPQRTPMQWDATAGAGFSTGEPWLPVADDYASANTQSLAGDPRSILTLYRRLIGLRRSRAALVAGAKRLVAAPHDIIAYQRSEGTERLLVALNLAHEPRELPPVDGTILLSTHLDRDDERLAGPVALRPDEGLIVDISR